MTLNTRCFAATAKQLAGIGIGLLLGCGAAETASAPAAADSTGDIVVVTDASIEVQADLDGIADSNAYLSLDSVMESQGDTADSLDTIDSGAELPSIPPCFSADDCAALEDPDAPCMKPACVDGICQIDAAPDGDHQI